MSSAPTFESTAAAVTRLGACAADFAQMTDDSLLEASSVIAAHSRTVDAYSAWVAAEISRRSDKALGYRGLAARQGFKNPVEMVQHISHISRPEAAKFVSVGVSLEASPSSSVSAVGVDVLDAINRGLGQPDEVISAVALEKERAKLIELSGTVTVEEIGRRARMVRDILDAESVARREKEQRDRRYWKNVRRTDGMVAGSYLLAPEQGALLIAAFQNLLSPRRSGPRFDDPRRVEGDTRTDEQFAADALVGMIQLAVDADPGTMFGVRKPAVRVIVRETDLVSGEGFGVLEDSHDPVSLETVEKLACDAGVIGIKFDGNGQAVDVGREQRLHTAKQRIMLAARDGGCMAPDCDMPVSMTVVHHPTPWSEGGETSVENGILLCDFDHTRYHELGYRIELRNGRYWLIPPPDIDPDQTPILLESKNPLMRQAQEDFARAMGDDPAEGEESAHSHGDPDGEESSAHEGHDHGGERIEPAEPAAGEDSASEPPPAALWDETDDLGATG